MNYRELWECVSDQVILLGHAVESSSEMKLILHQPTGTTYLLTKSNKSGRVDCVSFQNQHDGELSFDSLCVFGGYSYLSRDRFKGLEPSAVSDRKNLLK